LAYLPASALRIRRIPAESVIDSITVSPASMKRESEVRKWPIF